MSVTHSVDQAANAARFIADHPHEEYFDTLMWALREARDRSASEVLEWEQLRDLASAIKEHTLSHLADYLEQFEASAKRNGVEVHWAHDAYEHNQIVADILSRHGRETSYQVEVHAHRRMRLAPLSREPRRNRHRDRPRRAHDLYVQLVGGERPLRLTHTSSGYICCADWSPDGRQIAFGRCDDHGGGVFTVPALGGSERKLTDVICPHGDAGYPKWIADGKSPLLADSCVPEGPRGLVVFSLGTGEKRCLTAPPLYSEYGDSDPAMSPDGKTVAFERHTTIGPASVYAVALSGGNPRQVSPDGFAAWNPMWSSDGQYIIFNSARTGLNRVWRVPATGGAIALEAVYPATGTLSRDGRRLAYVEPLWFWQGRAFVISRIELSSAGGQVVSQKQVIASDGGNESAQPSPDGRQIVFQSNRTGRPEIWRSDADGSDLLQLTSFDNGFSLHPPLVA